MEKLLKRTQIYQGKILEVVNDEVIVDDKTITHREIVKHNGGACIALNDNGYYYLVKQYRYAFDEELYEFPAGKIEKGEKPFDTIVRECQEETGYSAKDIVALGYIIPTCGYSTEKIYLYYGLKDQKVDLHLDFDERISLIKLSFKEIKSLIKDNKIVDAKTIALVSKIEMEGLDG